MHTYIIEKIKIKGLYVREVRIALTYLYLPVSL